MQDCQARSGRTRVCEVDGQGAVVQRGPLVHAGHVGAHEAVALADLEAGRDAVALAQLLEGLEGGGGQHPAQEGAAVAQLELSLEPGHRVCQG